MSKKNVVRVIVFGTLGLILALVVLHPANWQYMFGPKIRGQTLWTWQNEFRVRHDPGWMPPWQKWIKDTTGFSLGGGPVAFFNSVPDHEDFVPLYRSLIDDASPRVRERASELLIAYADLDEAAPIAMKNLRSSVVTERGNAVWMLATLQRRHQFALEKKGPAYWPLPLLHADPATHPLIAEAVKDGTLFGLLEDSDPNVRLGAIEIVAAFLKEDTRVDAILRRSLKSAQPLERLSAFNGLVNRSPTSEESFHLASELAKSDPAVGVQYSAVDQLAKFGEKAAPLLLELAESAEPVHDRAIYSLASLARTHPKYIDDLVRLRDDDSRNYRDRVQELLHSVDPERFRDPRPIAAVHLGGMGEALGVEFPPELVRFSPENDGKPIFDGEKGEWDDTIRERGWIMELDGEYKLWYTGYDGTKTGIRRLGMALSPDGLAWTRFKNNPLLRTLWVEDMMVVKNPKWQAPGGAGLSIESSSAPTGGAGGAGVAGTGGGAGGLPEPRLIMVAEGKDDEAHILTSEDGVVWKSHGKLQIVDTEGKPISPGPYGTPVLFHDGQHWRLFYERKDEGVWIAHLNNGLGDSLTFRATEWRNLSDEPVLKPGGGEFEKDLIALNQIVKHRGRYYAFYHGSAKTGKYAKLWSTCVATSTDLMTWKKYDANPLFPPEANKSSGIILPVRNGFRLYTMHPKVYAHRSKYNDGE